VDSFIGRHSMNLAEATSGPQEDPFYKFLGFSWQKLFGAWKKRPAA
jgi:hypothetical protein